MELLNIYSKNSTDEEEKDKTSSFSINTSQYTEGTVLNGELRRLEQQTNMDHGQYRGR